MFDWFWDFIYGFSKALYQIIDAMIIGSKKLCGIEPVYIDDKPTDFISFLFQNEKVGLGFRAAVICAFVVLVFFAIFAIMKTWGKVGEKKTPGQIAGQTAKSVLLFLFVPLIMYVGTKMCNIIIEIIYDATKGAKGVELGAYLATIFGEGAWYPDADKMAIINGQANYADTSDMRSLMNLNNYNFLLSWICSLAIMFPVATMLIMFVERAISIVVLFIASPFSIASSVLDDGARFKLWRDQILVKYITGYGALVALNIYGILVNIVMTSGMTFIGQDEQIQVLSFSKSFLDSLLKIAVIIGGAFSLQKIMAVAGNLVSAGAGSNELRDAAIAGSGTGKFVGGAIGGVATAMGGGIIGSAIESKKKDWGEKLLDKVGLGVGKKSGDDKQEGSGEDDGNSGNGNSNQVDSGQNGNNINNVTDALENNAGLNNSSKEEKDDKKDNANNSKNKVLDNAISNSVNNSLNNEK